MKRGRRITFILSFFVIVTYSYNGYLSKDMVVGRYVNRNFGNGFIGENPHVSDTLMIYSNYQFYSKFYGKGTFKLFHNLGGTGIKLNYYDQFGKTSFQASIDRLSFGKSGDIYS